MPASRELRGRRRVGGPRIAAGGSGASLGRCARDLGLCRSGRRRWLGDFLRLSANRLAADPRWRSRRWARARAPRQRVARAQRRAARIDVDHAQRGSGRLRRGRCRGRRDDPIRTYVARHASSTWTQSESIAHFFHGLDLAPARAEQHDDDDRRGGEDGPDDGPRCGAGDPGQRTGTTAAAMRQAHGSPPGRGGAAPAICTLTARSVTPACLQAAIAAATC